MPPVTYPCKQPAPRLPPVACTSLPVTAFHRKWRIDPDNGAAFTNGTRIVSKLEVGPKRGYGKLRSPQIDRLR